MNNLDWISKWADLKPNSNAVTDLETGEKFSYRNLDEISSKICEYFSVQIKEGDRIAVLMEHSPYLVALFSACQRLGAILVPLNYRLSATEIQQQINDCKPSVLIYSEVFEEMVFFLKEHVETIRLIDFIDAFNTISLKSIQEKKSEIKEELPVFLFYTSGTTARPKGVLYTTKMLFWNSLNTSMQLGITSKDKTLNILPPYHTSGWNIFLTPLLHNGGEILILKKFEPARILSYLASERITLFMVLPTILQMLSRTSDFEKTELPELRYIICGGEGITKEQIILWKESKNVSIRPGYGLTEAGPSITSLHEDFAATHFCSIGKPNFYIELKIIDSEGNEINENETGELCIHGEIVTSGYWNNSVATKDKIKNGWFHTGDLAMKDEDGFFYLKGRIDDMYISGGENIFPHEIENVLKNHPEILNVQVIPFDDEIWGRKGVVFIKASNSKMQKEDLQEFMKDKLAKFKHPKEFIFLDEFPLTGFGKVSRKDLIRIYRENQSTKNLES